MKKIQEASGKFYIGRNYVPKFRGKLFVDEDLKTPKIKEAGPNKGNHAPRAHEMHLGLGKNMPCT